MTLIIKTNMADDKYNYKDYSLEHIRNRHETRVIAIMDNLLPQADDFCGCRVCAEDVYALALNAFSPHYVHTASIVLRRDPPTDQDLARAIHDAIDKVRIRPNHPE